MILKWVTEMTITALLPFMVTLPPHSLLSFSSFHHFSTYPPPPPPPSSSSSSPLLLLQRVYWFKWELRSCQTPKPDWTPTQTGSILSLRPGWHLSVWWKNMDGTDQNDSSPATEKLLLFSSSFPPPLPPILLPLLIITYNIKLWVLSITVSMINIKYIVPLTHKHMFS